MKGFKVHPWFIHESFASFHFFQTIENINEQRFFGYTERINWSIIPKKQYCELGTDIKLDTDIRAPGIRTETANKLEIWSDIGSNIRRISAEHPTVFEISYPAGYAWYPVPTKVHKFLKCSGKKFSPWIYLWTRLYV